MSRIDNLGEILDDYEGREHKEQKEEVTLTEEELYAALTDITGRMGMHNQVIRLDYEAKEAIAKAYYTCLFCNVGSPKKQESSVNTFCQDLELCLNNHPGNVKKFAIDYARYVEEYA